MRRRCALAIRLVDHKRTSSGARRASASRARCELPSPSPLPQQQCEERCGTALMREHQPVGQPSRDGLRHRELGQVAQRIGIAGRRAAVERETVEFDDQSESEVANILASGRPVGIAGVLPPRAWQPVSTLDTIPVATFEHRADPIADIRDHACDQSPPWDPRASRQRAHNPVERGLTRCSDARQRGEGLGDVVVSDQIDQLTDTRVLEPHPRRRPMPADAPLKICRAPDTHTRRWFDGPCVRYHDVHESRGRAWEGRPAAESRWPEREHRDPLALPLGERPGVVDEDSRMHSPQLPPPQHPLDVVGAQSELVQLPPSDHPVLAGEQLGQSGGASGLEHPLTVAAVGRLRAPRGPLLWTEVQPAVPVDRYRGSLWRALVVHRVDHQRTSRRLPEHYRGFP